MGIFDDTDNFENELLVSREEFERREMLKLLKRTIDRQKVTPPPAPEDPGAFATLKDAVNQGFTGLVQGGVEIARLPLVATAFLFDALDIGGTEEQQKEVVDYFSTIGKIRPEATTGFGRVIGDVTEFLGPTVGVGSIARKGVEKIVKGQIKRGAVTQATAFAGGEAILKTPELATGQIDTGEFLESVGLSGLTGASLGAVSAIPAKTMTARGARLVGEFAALAGTAPAIQGRLPSKEEAGYAALLVLGFKGVNAGVDRLARLRRQSVEDIREEVAEEASEQGKEPSTVIEKKIKKEEQSVFDRLGRKPLTEEEPVKTETPPESEPTPKPTEVETLPPKGEEKLSTEEPPTFDVATFERMERIREKIDRGIQTEARRLSKELAEFAPETTEDVFTRIKEQVGGKILITKTVSDHLGEPEERKRLFAKSLGKGIKFVKDDPTASPLDEVANSLKMDIDDLLDAMLSARPKKEIPPGIRAEAERNFFASPKGEALLKELEPLRASVLSGGKPGEFSPEEAETFRRAEEALQRGERGKFKQAIEKLLSEAPPTREDVARGKPVTEFKKVTEEEKKALFKEGRAIQSNKPDEVLQIGFDAIDVLPEAEALGKIQDLIKEVDQLRRKRRVSLPEQRAIAETLGLKEEDFFTKAPGTPTTPEETLVIGSLVAASRQNLLSLRDAVLEGRADPRRLTNATARHITLERLFQGFTGELGRGLRSVREVIENILGGARPDEVQAIFGSAEQVKRILPLKLAEMLRETKTPEELTVALKQLSRPGIVEMITELRINSLLSSPQTPVINAFSNSTIPFISIIERASASRLGKGGVQKGEAKVMFQELGKIALEGGRKAKESFEASLAYGWHNGFIDLMRLTARSFRAVEATEGLAKIEDFRVKAITAENFKHTALGKRLLSTARSMGSEELLARAIDFAGDFIRLPGTILVRTDELFKAINFRMELHAQAFRQAVSEGLEGKTRDTRITELMRDPLPAMQQAARELSFINTFTNETGLTGVAIQSFAHSHPLLRWFVLPFVRTPINIAGFALERTPALQFASKKFRDDFFGRNGIVRQDLAKGKMAFSLMLASTVGALVATGAITGKGPTRPNERKLWQDAGNQSYSIWDPIGKRWVSYVRSDPVGMSIGIMADLAHITAQLPTMELSNILVTVSIAMSNNITSKTYLKGLADFFDTLQEPRKKLPRFVKEQGASFFVPFVSGISFAEREIDPALRETRTLLDEFMEKIPGLSSNLPPRRNLKGEPIILDPGIGPLDIFAFYSSIPKDDPVAIEMVKNRMSIGLPRDTIFGTRGPEIPIEEPLPGEGVKLSLEEYDEFVRLAGNELKGPTGLGMWDALTALVKSDSYKALSDGPGGGKEKAMESIVYLYRGLARDEMLRRHPDLRQKVEGKLRRQAQQLSTGRTLVAF